MTTWKELCRWVYTVDDDRCVMCSGTSDVRMFYLVKRHTDGEFVLVPVLKSTEASPETASVTIRAMFLMCEFCVRGAADDKPYLQHVYDVCIMRDMRHVNRTDSSLVVVAQGLEV